MYFISSKLLIKRFQEGSFEDFEVAPYFVASTMLQSLLIVFSFGSRDPWSIVSGILILIITYAGIMHVRNQNGGTFGNGFINKWFVLGWITLVRTFLIGFPALVLLILIGTAIDRRDGALAASALGGVIYISAYYWWLGLLVAETNETAESK